MDLVPVLIGTAVAGLFVAAAIRRPSVARATISILFLVSAIFNATVTYSTRDHIYLDMVAGPYVPDLYRDFTLAFVIPNATLFTLSVVAFELAIAGLVLTRGLPVKLALMGAVGWLLTMWLFAPAEGIVFSAIAQIGSALGCLLMLRKGFPSSVLEPVIHRRLRQENARA